MRSTEGRGRGAKAEIISDSVINGPRRVAVLCFSSESDTGTWRGQQSGRGARQGRIVTAVRIRQSDCRHSKQDVTYPSAGILLLPFSGRPRRGEKKEKNHTEISSEIIPQKHQTPNTALLMPVAILARTHRAGEGGGAAVGHMWSERGWLRGDSAY